MVFNNSIRYLDGNLFVDGVSVQEIVQAVGTPLYIYSLKRSLENYLRVHQSFSGLDTHIHYSAKANSNLALMKVLSQAGAGIDTVSIGEIYRAMQAGVKAENIVFAGVGKTYEEIQYAVEQGIGWFNVENVLELDYIQQVAESLGRDKVRVALRLNPQVTANTHPYISTGHGGAKFGLTAEVIQSILSRQSDYPRINISGIHLHIGSQLGDISATQQAVKNALALIEAYPHIRTINMGGGLPAAYRFGEEIPSIENFAEMLKPLLKDYRVLLEPGRAIVADAGILIAKILYVKKQAGQTFYISDGSMAELIRPALYQAYHEIVPLVESSSESISAQIVGPICETTDVLGRDRSLPELNEGDTIAMLTAGAYGMVMASNYNARLRPPEVVVSVDGESWSIARKRETLADLLAHDNMFS